MADQLAASAIGYSHSPALAGLRGRSKTIDDEINGYWHNQSFHNYADYALTEVFQQALTELIEQGRRKICAIMCSEAVWWRCHRRIIADHLLHRGLAVALTPGAVVAASGRLIYPKTRSPS